MATILGWTTVFYHTWFITSRIFDKIGITNRGMAACNASMVGLFLDLQVDPVASEVGLWNWNETLQAGFLGVPTLNFVSWFWAVSPFAYMVFYVNSKQGWNSKKRVLVLLVSVPFCQVAAGALTLGTMFLLEGGESPALRILIDGIRMHLNN